MIIETKFYYRIHFYNTNSKNTLKVSFRPEADIQFEKLQDQYSSLHPTQVREEYTMDFFPIFPDQAYIVSIIEDILIDTSSVLNHHQVNPVTNNFNSSGPLRP